MVVLGRGGARGHALEVRKLVGQVVLNRARLLKEQWPPPALKDTPSLLLCPNKLTTLPVMW